MRRFHVPPHTKPLYPVFQLAMIASHYYKQREKTREGHIPKLVPLLLEQRDGHDGADQEDGEPPSSKARAGLSRPIQETIDSRQEAKEQILSVWVSV